MSRSGKIVRPTLRFVASVLITSGILLLLDAGLTVAWQEPVSSFLAQRQQNQLSDRLDNAERSFGLELPKPQGAEPPPARVLKRLARQWRARVKTGDPIGRIDLPSLGRRYVAVQGTDVATLRKGPGHYPGTEMPGEGGTVAIAGHRTTYLAPFRTIDNLKPGQRIVLDMPYARFTYAVERTQVVPPTATWITRDVPGRERLVLSACHPLYSAAKRIIVFARLASVAAT